MDSSPDNFESLEKLLKLKRYEQPPPRYFSEFSGKVMSRIEAGEARTSLWEKFGFDLRPAFAAMAGMFACGLVVYGVATTDGSPTVPGLGDMTSTSGLLASRLSGGNSTNLLSEYEMPAERQALKAGIIPASYRQ
jgi:hypothetical protein